jgi:putative ATPase
MEEWGYKKEYKYPHSFPGAWVQQDYLPDQLVGRRFYKDKDQGEEPKLAALWKNRMRKR